ncbi:hypothetical protein KIN20_021348 [Parelaphostrongylus tenuis]|uniref:Uncharacterized protein n=1 Tax=Parelaphostrongylus tenuis TaxID=148309 RepID=A0AAD5MNT7_PARTN|nr:hypothetical protein KIN20_021348 [Parelaphostrongylus tenuis]
MKDYPTLSTCGVENKLERIHIAKHNTEQRHSSADMNSSIHKDPTETECDDVIEIPRGYDTVNVTASEMSNTARPSCTFEEEQRARECEEAIRLLLDFTTKSERIRSLTSVRFESDIPKAHTDEDFVSGALLQGRKVCKRAWNSISDFILLLLSNGSPSYT